MDRFMKARKERTSDVLLAMVEEGSSERISVGDLVDRMADRAFGFLILLLALPNCVPSPPGLSTITGLPIIVFALQIAIGGHRPWLPRFLRDRTFKREDLKRLLTRVLPYIRRFERISRPRLTGLLQGPAERILGMILFVLSIIMALPIPLGNLFPSVAIAIIAIALLEQDGIALLIGYAAGGAAASIAFAVLVGIVKLAAQFLHQTIG